MQTATNQRLEAARGCVIVRPVETAEQRANSPIILLEDTREKLASCQMLVVSVGADEPCPEDNITECGQADVCYWNGVPGKSAEFFHRTDKRIKPDAWILVRPRSLVEISSADKLYSVKISDVVGVFVEDALTDSAA